MRRAMALVGREKVGSGRGGQGESQGCRGRHPGTLLEAPGLGAALSIK